MALSTGSKILVSDISTALNGKIDTAGTGLSKSGTTLALATVTTSGGTAGPTANATPAFNATFTVPKVVYDKYGRVTGHTNYTVKIPAAPAGANPKAYITTTYISGTNGYRKWSDGWIEQWGRVSFSGTDTVTTVTFPTAFSNTNYAFVYNLYYTNTNLANTSNFAGNWFNSITTTSVKILEDRITSGTFHWHAWGF